MKQAGMGDNFYVGAYNISGDINSLGTISGGPAAIDVTGIDKSATERLGGARTGQMDFVSYFNPASGQAHPVLSALPRTDVQLSYFRGTSLGNPVASMISKQTSYDPTRGQDGDLTFAVSAVSNGYGLEWGNSLTPGVRTDTAATNGDSIDTLASASFGGQAYLHVFGFTGTDATVKIQDSANNSTWTDVTSFGFTAVAGLTSQRISLGSTATLRRYLRAVSVTTGGFTSLSFAVNVVKNTTTAEV